MGSGASKANAPKGGKRKKNDPRAQLERLVQGGNVRGVADLLSKKTELTNSALDDKSGTRAIHIACKNGDKDMIRELMKRNCFLNQKDAKGCTALMLAAAAGHDKIVKLIVDGGADVRMKDRNDDTALEYAEKNNRVKVKVAQRAAPVPADPNSVLGYVFRSLTAFRLSRHTEYYRTLASQLTLWTFGGRTALQCPRATEQR